MSKYFDPRFLSSQLVSLLLYSGLVAGDATTVKQDLEYHVTAIKMVLKETGSAGFYGNWGDYLADSAIVSLFRKVCIPPQQKVLGRLQNPHEFTIFVQKLLYDACLDGIYTKLEEGQSFAEIESQFLNSVRTTFAVLYKGPSQAVETAWIDDVSGLTQDLEDFSKYMLGKARYLYRAYDHFKQEYFRQVLFWCEKCLFCIDLELHLMQQTSQPYQGYLYRSGMRELQAWLQLNTDDIYQTKGPTLDRLRQIVDSYQIPRSQKNAVKALLDHFATAHEVQIDYTNYRGPQFNLLKHQWPMLGVKPNGDSNSRLDISDQSKAAMRHR